MSKSIVINGTVLVSLKEAARSISYSRDYLAKLARDEKIFAKQVGRQWFVEMSSVQAFLNESALEQEVRNKNLREERRRELYAKKNLEALADEISVERVKSPMKSFLVSAMVLFLGLLTGAIFNSVDSLVNFNERFLASSLASQNVGGEISVLPSEEKAALFSETNEYPLFVDEAKVSSMKEMKSGIILFAEGGEIKKEENIQELFSDNVSINFSQPGQGDVVYEDNEGGSRSIPFLVIPKNNSVTENNVLNY